VSPSPSTSSSPKAEPGTLRLTSFRYNKGRKRFSGVLVSSDKACRVHRKVEVRKVAPGKDDLVGKARSGSVGAWTLKRKNSHGRFYAEAPATKHPVLCEGALSKKVEVKKPRKNPGTVTTLPPATGTSVPPTTQPTSTTPTTQPPTTQPPTTQPPTSTTCVDKPGPDPCDF
jgi:hypothetical protein